MNNKLSKKDVNAAIESAVNVVLEKQQIKPDKKTKKAIGKVSHDIYAFLKEELVSQNKKIAKLEKSFAKAVKKKKKKKPEKVEIVESI